jgi:hypothetical protein
MSAISIRTPNWIVAMNIALVAVARHTIISVSPLRLGSSVR